MGIIISIDFHLFQRGSNHQPVMVDVFGGGFFNRIEVHDGDDDVDDADDGDGQHVFGF